MTPTHELTLDPDELAHDGVGAGLRARVAVLRRPDLDDGVVKQASGHFRRALRHEADLLERIGASCLVEPIELLDHDEHTDLLLRDAGPYCLATLPENRPDLTLRALQRLVEAVDQLHRLGWAHGALCAEHVVVNERGTVRLCSVGSARPIASAPGSDRLDLVAMLDVIEGAATQFARSEQPLRGALRRRSLVVRLRRVVELARRALDRDELHLDELARELRAVRLRHHGAGDPGTRPPRRSMVAGVVACAAIATVLLYSACAGPGPADREPVPTLPPRPVDVTSASTDPVSTTPASTVPASTAPVSATVRAATPCAGPQVDVDGDGCDDTISVDGARVVIGDAVLQLGTTADRAAVGDWDCDGVTTARLLQSASGRVFEFDGWAASGKDLTGRLIGTADGALDVVRGDDPDRDGCDVLHVVGPDGSEVMP